ncbi:MAG: hypothetical protein E7665_10150 [Ruminococcaceae bacterium]|nr:hypothetical protein [Oscillospiraceae bacterium]
MKRLPKRKVIDVHTHILGYDPEANIASLVKAAEVYNIDKLLISPLKSLFSDEEEVKYLNDYATDAVKRYPDIFDAYVYLNPVHDNALELMKREIEDKGKVAVKLWMCTFCDDPRAYPIYEKCIEYDIPVLIHSFLKTVGQLENETTGVHVHNVAQRYPEAKIVMAHLGANCYHGVKAIRNDKNVWVDFCGSIYRGDDLDYTIRQVGTDRVLFGTDMPGSYTTNYGQVLDADITEAQADDILYNNTAKLFDRLHWYGR